MYADIVFESQLYQDFCDVFVCSHGYVQLECPLFLSYWYDL